MQSRLLIQLALAPAIALTLACTRGETGALEWAIPEQSDWTDCGPVLSEGRDGEWDRYLWGGFAASVIHRDGGYLLYYQGADGYSEEEATVMHRAIGVARSADGIKYTKYDGNPVLTFSPRGNLEEGAVSSAAIVGADGIVTLFYGANTWAGGLEVNADARRATSRDGLEFVDEGVVLSRADRRVWGSGDEVFPIAVFRDGNREVVYYIPNGTPERGRLGVAWFDGGGFNRSAEVRSGRRPIPVWGPGSAVRMSQDRFALFLNNHRGDPVHMEVRMVSPHAPERAGAPIRRYVWEGITPRSVVRDEASGRWFLYYRGAGNRDYGVMTAGGEQPPC